MTGKELAVDLSDEVIVITGGGGVLCSTIARAMAAHGAAIAVLDLKPEAAGAVADEIAAAGGRALPVECNVLERETLEAAAEQVEKALGTPTALINGAGGNHPSATTSDELSFFDLPKDAFQWVFNLNFIGTLLPTQVFGLGMAERERGHILNVASMSGYRPLTKVGAYSAAKAAVMNFTQWLAVHISQNYSTALRVNAIAPGFFLTEQNRFLLTDEQTGELTPRGELIIAHTPMARFGDPEELVGTILFLLSDSSRFVHGTVIPIDGGFNAFAGV